MANILLDSQRLPRTLTPWLMWLAATSFALFQFFLQLSSGVMVDEMMTTFNLTTYGAGTLIAVYYYIYVFLQTPAGVLIDRYGVRKLLTLGSLICGIGCFIFGQSENLTSAVLGRLLMGGGASFAFVGSIKIMRDHFPARLTGTMIGFTETLGMLLTVIGTLFLAQWIDSVGWRDSMSINGIVLVILSIWSMTSIRDKPNTSESENISFKSRLLSIILDWRMWVNGFYCGLMFSVVTVFAALWGVPFLQKNMGVNLTWSTAACTMIMIGVGTGSPLMAYIADKTDQYRMIMIISSLITAILFTLVLLIPGEYYLTLFILLFFVGVGVSSYILCFQLANFYAEPYAQSTATGFTNALCVITAPLLQPIIGYLLFYLAMGHSLIDQLEYSLNDYRFALGLMPALMVISAILAYCLPDHR